MKLLGLIGGVSPESTLIYYQLLNQFARRRLGGQHSANVLFYALDYGVMIRHYEDEKWNAFRDEVVRGARAFEGGGRRQALVICSNTTHLAAEAAQAATGLPLIHLLDALVSAVGKAGTRQAALIWNACCDGRSRFICRISKNAMTATIVAPSGDEQALIGQIILDELVEGRRTRRFARCANRYHQPIFLQRR